MDDEINTYINRLFSFKMCVQGVHCQERHLFLFNDLLLVAKAKSGSNFKLKDKVRISEIWLNESPAVIDEVAEIPKSSDTSFVIGWPTTNYVAVFRLVLYPHIQAQISVHLGTGARPKGRTFAEFQIKFTSNLGFPGNRIHVFYLGTIILLG